MIITHMTKMLVFFLFLSFFLGEAAQNVTLLQRAKRGDFLCKVNDQTYVHT